MLVIYTKRRRQVRQKTSRIGSLDPQAWIRRMGMVERRSGIRVGPVIDVLSSGFWKRVRIQSVEIDSGFRRLLFRYEGSTPTSLMSWWRAG